MSHFPVWYSLTKARHRCTGTQLVPGTAQICISPSEPNCTDAMQDLEGCILLAHPDLVFRAHAPLDSLTLANPPQEKSSFSGSGYNLAHSRRPLEPPHLAHLSGQSPAVIDTNHLSQSNLYEVAVCFEVNWCSSQGKEPQRCTISRVIYFLKERLEVWLSLSTLKVYMAARSCTSPCNKEAHLIFRFLRGAMRFNYLMTYSLLGSSLWC